MKKYKRFHIIQQQKFLSLSDIQKVLVKYKSIKRFAYILHNQDTYTKEDEEKDHSHKQGTLKTSHWHIALELKTNAMTVETIAKWFCVPIFCVKGINGRNAMIDCVEYLIHESPKAKAENKHIYADEEVNSNFEWRKELNAKHERVAKYSNNVDKKVQLRYQVLYEGLSLRKLTAQYPFAYQKDWKTLDKLRMKYISQFAPVPKTRINYYVYGEGGIGKGLICKAIARNLYPNMTNDDDIFFEIGGNNVSFEGYDGQPVIIWNDKRSYELLKMLGGRGNLFNIFDTHPGKEKQNIKFGSINLCNEVNIVNGIETYREFLDGLTQPMKHGDKIEDKNQSYRRFSFIIPMHEKNFDLLINKGFYYGTREYDQYVAYLNIKCEMERIALMCGDNEQKRREIESIVVESIIKEHRKVLDKIEQNSADDESLENLLNEYKESSSNARIQVCIDSAGNVVNI